MAHWSNRRALLGGEVPHFTMPMGAYEELRIRRALSCAK